MVLITLSVANRGLVPVTLDPFNRVVQDGTLQLTGHLAQRTFDLSTTFRHEVVITVASERLPDTASPAPANMIL